MAVLQMQRLSICALKKDRQAILEKLQALGVMEVNQVAGDDDDFVRVDTRDERQDADRLIHLSEQAIAVLDEYAPAGGGLLAGIAGKKVLSRSELDKAVSRRGEMVAEAGRITGWQKEIAESRASILKLENQIEALRPWKDLDVPMTFEGTERTALLIGTMPPDTTLDGVCACIAGTAPEAAGTDVEVVASDAYALYITVMCLKEDRRAVEDALRAGGFTRAPQSSEEAPARAIEDMQAGIDGIKAHIEELRSKIISEAGRRGDMKLLGDYCRMQEKEYEVVATMPQGERSFIISGYVPARYSDAVRRAMTENFDCVVDIDKLEEGEDAPVVLSNNKFSRSLEGIVESFGLPGKGEVDPTTIMSFFYVFFFGMMLSDAAYGLIMALGCFTVLRRFPGMGSGLRKSLQMFMWCGVSTVFWGCMFGGFFGDAVTVIGRTFFDRQWKFPALWFEPINDPMRLLVWSLAFGIIHMFVGLGIKAYMEIRKHDYMGALCDVGFWYMLLTGLILMLVGSPIFASFAGREFDLPDWVAVLAKVLAIAGALGIVLMSERGRRIGLRIAMGAYDLYGATSWLSDTLSYSRLLALGLATGVIANVINLMGSMAGGGVGGAILFIIVFIAGHTLNLAINVLGAYVHTNRLQFVEFFGKFYEGGGKPFEPLTQNTKYIDIKEEF